MKTGTLLASAVAGIIGSGWLLGPLASVRIAGPAAIIAWPIGGLMMMMIATTFVLLTRAKPITGGTAQFFEKTYGDFAGFAFAWICWLAWIAVSPIETMAMIQYGANYIPHLMTHSTHPELTPIGLTVAAACLLLITLINTRGIHFYSKINTVILAFKLLVPIATGLILITTHFHLSNFTAGAGFMPSGWRGVFAALPLGGVIYSFIGYNPVIQCAAESENPRRSIPIAIVGALTICMLVYILVQGAFIAALPPEAIKNGWSAIRFTGDAGPFAGLLALFGFTWFVKVIYADAIVSPFGTGMVQSMATSRLTYGMSQCGYFPKYFMGISKKGIPLRALLCNMLIGLLFFLPFPSWQHMVGFLVSCLVMGYVIGPMSLLVIATKNPADFKGFPILFIHLICVVALTVCSLMIFWSGWNVICKIMFLFLVGYLILFLTWYRHKKRNAHKSLHILRGAWVILFLAGLTIISYLGSFGGHHLIPFGLDFLIIGLFSLMVYIVAYVAVMKTEKIIDI